jgi:hypothetical protein
MNLETCWASLKHGGLLIAPSRLPFLESESLPDLPPRAAEELRRRVTLFQDGVENSRAALLDYVLEQVLGLEAEGWDRNPQASSWSHRAITGEAVRPRRVWQGPGNTVLPVFVLEEPRIGIGRGRREAARVVEWLRRSGHKFAFATNGRQWRLVYAGSDWDAWCESDVDLWFEAGRPGPQVDAMRLLLSPHALLPRPDKPARLIEAIDATRKGEAEITADLGERVREAVEQVLYASAPVIDELRAELRLENRDIYNAAVRLVLRCVVILYAEARNLLPREHPLYYRSYGLEGLRDQLERIAGGRAKERLRQSDSAWPRLLSLFRLVYHGCPHEALVIPRYGGELFRPGDPDSSDAVLRALAAFEHARNRPADHIVHQALHLLTRTRIKVRCGLMTEWVEAPVDFAGLSTAYIGILYEGLLDYQLKRADAPVVFLNLGDQPALPFLDLQGLGTERLKSLFEKFKAKSASTAGEEEAEEEEEAVEETEEAAEEEPESEAEEAAPVTLDAGAEWESADKRQQREAVYAWAESAVRDARLVKPPGRSRDAREAYERGVHDAARALIGKVAMPGEWYLVRYGNTRKGTGTFYTPPQLARPIVHRALEPLCYESRGAIRKPEEILAIKVCDPAMGSGSFLVTALRFLVERLRESLHAHGRLRPSGSGTICRLADGGESGSLADDPVPVPLDHPEFEERLAARLKRHVVERCLYGVDTDGLAVIRARGQRAQGVALCRIGSLELMDLVGDRVIEETGVEITPDELDRSVASYLGAIGLP